MTDETDDDTLGAASAHQDRPPIEVLRDIGIFGGLDDHTLETFVRNLPTSNLAPGSAVFREGDQGRELFVVLGGEMEVLKKSKGDREARVAVLGPGDWFGEMSILDVMPRSATVRVLAPSRVLRLSASDLDSLYRRDVKSYAIIVLNVAREMSRRLRVADGILAEMIANVTDAYLKR
ncbi:MAG: cyclic nucleotide-binding domain-containing protein [Polyangiaceae bacterium]